MERAITTIPKIATDSEIRIAWVELALTSAFPYRNGRSVSGANAASEAAFWGQNAASSRLKRSCIFIEAALQEMFPQKLCRFCVVTRRISILIF